MSRNIEIVRKVYVAFGRGDNLLPFEHYADDIEWDLSRGMEGVGGVHRGHEGVRNSFRDLLTAFSVIEFEVEEIVETGDRVLATVHERYLGRTSDVDVDRRHYAVFTFRDGKILKMCVYLDRSEALAAAGRHDGNAARLAERLAAFNETGVLGPEGLAADFEVHQASSIVDTAGVFRGRDALRDSLRELQESFDDLRFEPERLLQAPGGEIVVLIHARGVGRGSGVEIDNHIAWVCTFRGDEAVRLDVYEEQADALAAAGLPA